ncbi:hypothetical protein BDN71DRAFT_1510843 [Pleurotus eryngii]|uniref:Uncharacterized protein n=1 Tax=Pleurotus eryngii TaxID=5323 RepID=A0A9P5ZRA2_PLEER|nr:hypothetical protein BDN71DRAFT_1510843 [Pleurotus eryngii]
MVLGVEEYTFSHSTFYRSPSPQQRTPSSSAPTPSPPSRNHQAGTESRLFSSQGACTTNNSEETLHVHIDGGHIILIIVDGRRVDAPPPPHPPPPSPNSTQRLIAKYGEYTTRYINSSPPHTRSMDTEGDG